ncbi:NAD(P)-binding [Fusarium albosuccineum]|uniref:NAD(P)-binding n=1 Tax=Fusarium albosuccineum TaxID=1237068 RepID=A0A8H4LFL4_9HYPO|nr:NAD(P)-binding [Fusarium albosuccineum]
MATDGQPTYLITAAAGHIGTRLVPLLLSQASRPKLVLPTNNPERLKSQLASLPDRSRIQVIHGDIQDPIFLGDIFKSHGVTAAFLCLTGENELMVTLNFFDAMRRVDRVKHLVYLSACGDFDLEAIKSGMLNDNAAGHVLVKPIVEAKLRYGLLPRSEPGGFSWTIIGPTLFYDNDLRSKDSIVNQGIFNEPLGSKGVSRVGPADIALAVANALDDDGKVWAGKKVMVGSLKTYTNIDVAKLWSEALGTRVTPIMSTEHGLAGFEAHYRNFVSTTFARDMRLMYEYFERHGFRMNEAEYQDQVALLGKSPTSYEEFVKRIAEEWKAS